MQRVWSRGTLVSWLEKKQPDEIMGKDSLVRRTRQRKRYPVCQRHTDTRICTMHLPFLPEAMPSNPTLPDETLHFHPSLSFALFETPPFISVGEKKSHDSMRITMLKVLTCEWFRLDGKDSRLKISPLVFNAIPYIPQYLSLLNFLVEVS